MISISGNPISMYYRNYVMDSWTSKGYIVNHFEAVTPDDLSNYNFLKIKRKHSNRTKTTVDFTETEIAVWYSHFSTWKLCYDMNKPIIVIEHDIKLLKDIDEEVYNYPIACLAHVVRKGVQVKLGGGAYYITPKGAHELMKIKNHKEIVKNSDAWIHNRCDVLGKWFIEHSTQIKDDKIGVTVTHNK